MSSSTDFQRACEILGVEESAIYTRIRIHDYACIVVLQNQRERHAVNFKPSVWDEELRRQGIAWHCAEPAATHMAKLLGIFSGLSRLKLRLRDAITNASAMLMMPDEVRESINTLYTLQGKHNRVESIKALLNRSYEEVRHTTKDHPDEPLDALFDNARAVDTSL